LKTPGAKLLLNFLIYNVSRNAGTIFLHLPHNAHNQFWKYLHYNGLKLKSQWNTCVKIKTGHDLSVYIQLAKSESIKIVNLCITKTSRRENFIQLYRYIFKSTITFVYVNKYEQVCVQDGHPKISFNNRIPPKINTLAPH
jgi:hypothetical protein